MDSVIKKIMLFRNTRNTSELAIERLFMAYRALGKELKGFEVILGGSVEYINPLSQGFTHGLIFSFSSREVFGCYMTNATAQDLNRHASKLFRYPEDVLIMNLPDNQSFMDVAWEQEAAAS